MKLNTSVTSIALSALLLSGALAVSAGAQAVNQSSAPAAATTRQDAADTSSYSTGKPLEMQSKEGFWGHMNPMARKKWVRRQIDPVKDRVNELDQLQAKNANDIRDVDSRATAGIKRASDAAALADQHATAASNRADSANSTATAASTRTDALHGTVSNLDQYQTVQTMPVMFTAGRTTLGTKAKAELDEVAAKLASQKGYILEVQGYSRAGVATSQAMADSVVRYLVTEHQVPVYRIYRSGLGKASAKSTPDGEKALVNGVRLTVLHNSLAAMDNAPAAPSTTSRNSPPAGMNASSVQ